MILTEEPAVPTDAPTEELPVIPARETQPVIEETPEPLPVVYTPAPTHPPETPEPAPSETNGGGTGGEQKPQATATESSQGGRRGRGWPWSKDFPYRRQFMYPQEGIEIRLAGITVWPLPEEGAASSPLLNLLNRQ